MKTEPIFLSVVLSTYNDEKYIAEAIQSILDQTYPYFEFIIVNDGSTDSTLNIIKSFKDDRIVLIDKPNTGLIDSLNTGVRIAKYDWIARMDGDDIAEPYRFEEQTKAIKKGIVIVSSQCSIIDSNGISIGATRFLTSRIGIVLSKALEFPLIVHPVVLFKKKAFEKVGGYDKNMYVAEDYDLWCKILSLGSVHICTKRLLRLRKHGDNISVQKSEEQRINLLIGYVKYLFGINRVLTYIEYQILREAVLSSDVFYKHSECSGVVSFILSRIKRYILIKHNKSFKQILTSKKNNANTITNHRNR